MKKKSKDNLQKLSPGRRQYLNIKNQYQDCLLLYRMGDFYETFDEDAKILSSVLDIALTARDVGAKNKVPLAGIPYHSLDNSLSKLMDSLRAKNLFLYCFLYNSSPSPSKSLRVVLQLLKTFHLPRRKNMLSYEI